MNKQRRRWPWGCPKGQSIPYWPTSNSKPIKTKKKKKKKKSRKIHNFPVLIWLFIHRKVVGYRSRSSCYYPVCFVKKFHSFKKYLFDLIFNWFFFNFELISRFFLFFFSFSFLFFFIFFIFYSFKF